MSHELAGRVALVTGASKGIGAGIATAYGVAGAKVAVGYACPVSPKRQTSPEPGRHFAFGPQAVIGQPYVITLLARRQHCRAPARPMTAAANHATWKVSTWRCPMLLPTVDGVPLPADVLITHADTPLQRQWGGAWVGVWDGVLYQKHILLVEAITADGSAQVTYAVGDSPFMNIQRQWTRHKATVSERNLSISEPDLSVTYEAKGKDALEATYVRGADRSRAKMMRVDQGALTTPGAVVDWLGGRSEFLQTDLVEGGKPVRLEAIIFKPSGSGPFPLAVFNHGSTGDGRTPAKFKHTFFFIDLAAFLNERGWLVAFPQRRGRGKSDGEYDEGFPPDRAQGYACEPEIALAGAKRGLGDIDAAVAALRRRPDVAASRILMAGQSRGGILSVAYAGDHADQTFGVINFAGGWLSEQRCPEAKLVSQTLFKRGVRFRRPTIWLYGRNDSFYSIPFSRANFSAFQDAGGQGVFLEYDVPGGNGHLVISHPSLWSTPVGSYLDSLAAAQK